MARPRLKPGERGNYHLSRNESKKRDIQKQLKQTKQKQKATEARLKRLQDSQDTLKNGQKLAGFGGTTTQEFISQLPKDIREDIEDNTEIVFRPNKGPQVDFLAAPEKEVMYGGAAGGGKSFAMLVDLLRYASNGNHRALLLRRPLAELTALVDQSRKLYPKAFPGAIFRESKNTWSFPSGATALFSYVDKDVDVTRYQGQSFTWIGIDELGQYPSSYVWDYLRSRLRTTDPSIETYMRASANPGGVGGWWLKKMFVDPAPPNESFWATDIESGKILRYGVNHPIPADKPLYQRRFIPARLTDNPFLMESGEYEAMLLSLPEVERRRLLEGDWDVADGAAFAEFDRTKHVVEPFEIPYNWPRLRAADYGYSSPSCVLWGAVDWDGTIWIYRELYNKGYTGESLANLVSALEDNDPLMQISVLDGSCWSKHGTGPSIAETMIRNGVRWIPADKNRLPGKIELQRRLAVDERTEEPKLKIFATCTNLIRTLPTIPLSKTNSEDVDTKAEDHAYDALRYMCMTRPTGLPQHTLFNQIKKDTFQPADRVFGY